MEKIAVREEVQVDGQLFKVRTLFDTNGKPINSATVGKLLRYWGFAAVPYVGSLITNKNADLVGRQEEEKPLKRDMEYILKRSTQRCISVILVADTQGSLEAIVNALPEGIKLVNQKTGEVK